MILIIKYIPTILAFISVVITGLLCVFNNVSFLGSTKRLGISALVFYIIGIILKKSLKDILLIPQTQNENKTKSSPKEDIKKPPEIEKEEFKPLNPDVLDGAVRVIKGSLRDNGRN